MREDAVGAGTEDEPLADVAYEFMRCLDRLLDADEADRRHAFKTATERAGRQAVAGQARCDQLAAELRDVRVRAAEFRTLLGDDDA